MLLDRHRWLFLALGLTVGSACGAAGALVNGGNRYEIPFLEWSVGLYVVPSVLLGWVAVSRRAAALGGSVACLGVVLGHWAADLAMAESQTAPEYGAWALVGLTLGGLLGFCGNRIRSHVRLDLALAAGFPLGLMALFLAMAVRAHVETGARVVHPVALVIEGVLALLVLVLCRGWVARGAALLCAVALVIPLALGLTPVFSLVWFASGDY